MTCKYSNTDGKCTILSDDTFFVSESVIVSCDDEGYCLVVEDANPDKSCDSFEYDR